MRQGLARLEEVEEGPEKDAVRALIELTLGTVHYRQTNNQEAIPWLEAAALHAERAGERGTLATRVLSADAAHSDSGSSAGLRYLELARPIYEELGDLRGLGVVLSNLGIHAYYEGRWDESLALYRESREFKERAGDFMGLVVQVNNEAEILSDQGHVAEASPMFDEVLRLSRESGWAIGEGLALSNLGRRPPAWGGSRRRTGSWGRRSRYLKGSLPSGSRSKRRRARMECLVFEGRHQEALAVATAYRGAAAKAPVGGIEALFER